MDFINHFRSNLSNVNSDNFDQYALSLFQYQAENNKLYKSYIQHLGLQSNDISRIIDIPFLPIEFFKSHIIKTSNWDTQKMFQSSGTTSTGRSQHHLDSLEFYHLTSWEHATTIFKKLQETEMIALLPSYLEQGDSSLIEMLHYFISKSHQNSGFHLYNFQSLSDRLQNSANPVILFGVTYALLDFADSISSIDHPELTIVETGGMKGRKKEITIMEVHEKLKETFVEATIYSEYGMTELMSQAYGRDGDLKFPAWCKPLSRDLNDPFTITEVGSGGLNVIDLANAHSIAFIETKDLVKIDKEQNFRILGRMDNSDIRGCSLLI